MAGTIRVFVCSFSPAADGGGNGGFEWSWTREQALEQMREWLDRYAGQHNLSLTILTLPADVNAADGNAVTQWIDHNLHLIEPTGDFGQKPALTGYFVQMIQANFVLTAALTGGGEDVEVGSGYYVTERGTSRLVWGPGTPADCDAWIAAAA